MASLLLNFFTEHLLINFSCELPVKEFITPIFAEPFTELCYTILLTAIDIVYDIGLFCSKMLRKRIVAVF